MTLSREQLDIINTAKILEVNEILKINAFAGTGKTTTLNQITNSLTNKTFLYLAFNKDIVTEAKKRFRNNVFATTINSLAYRKIIIDGNYKLADYELTALRVSEIIEVDITDAYDILRIYTIFCNSNLKDILTVSYIPKRKTSFLLAKKLFELISNKEIDANHSFYLKEYQLKEYAKDLNFDYVLLDEAQDTNSVTLEILSQINSRKIVVGDTHQTIYQFRGSVNAMEYLESNYTLFLTTTYRCNQKIVDIANSILKEYKKEKKELTSGAIQDNTIESTAYITRTNAELINLIEKLENFNCLKDINDVFSLSQNVHLFNIGKRIENKKFQFLNKFKNSENESDKKGLKSYAEKTNDLELLGAIFNAQIYKGYLFVLKNKALKKHSKDSKNILVTGHSSKGLEWDKVIVAEDFKDPYSYDGLDYISESNLLYVVATRAKKELHFENNTFLESIL